MSDALALPTPAWLEFCQTLPKECAVDLSEPEFLVLTPETWSLLVEVNLRANAAIRPVTDLAHWSVEDRWDFPDDGAGDCEDIQLLKRRWLVEAGLPRRALLMTVVLDEDQAGHAVLMARTDRGDFILDNKTALVASWEDTPYRYLKREGSDGGAWVALAPGQAPLVTAQAAAQED